MKRLARYTFTLCAMGSLALCVVACVMWERSFWTADQLERGVAKGYDFDRSIVSIRGCVYVHLDDHVISEARAWRWGRADTHAFPQEPEAYKHRIGPVGFERDDDPQDGTVSHNFTLPYWSIVFGLATLPVASWLTRRTPWPIIFHNLSVVCTALSLVLCVVVSLLWLRSYWREDRLFIKGMSEGGEPRVLGSFAQSDEDSIYIYWTADDEEYWRVDSISIDSKALSARAGRRAGLTHWWQRLGFDFTDCSKSGFVGGPSGYMVLFPHAAVVVLCGIAPATWALRRLVGKWRHGEGYCSACGYDLRASPGCCPECGTARGGVAGESAGEA